MSLRTKNITRQILIILVLSLSLCNSSQAQYWEGYGSGLNYARIQNDTIFYEVGRIHKNGIDHHRNQNLICENLKPGINSCKTFDEETLEFKYYQDIEISQKFDTISMNYPKYEPKLIFVKNNLTEDQINAIDQIEIELYSEYNTYSSRTTVNFRGFLKIEKFGNDPVTIKLTQNELDAIRRSIKHLNYTQLNSIYGMRNFTSHSQEKGFRFITKDNSNFHYISVDVPEVFNPLILTIGKLKKKKMKKTKR